MRELAIAIASIGLVACQPAASIPSPAPAEPPPAATPAPAAPEAMTAIPAPYLGKWDATVEDCGRASIMTLTISPNEVRFHESIGEIRTVTPDGDGILVAGPFDGEGQSWEGALRLALSADQTTLTVTNNGTATTRVRCS